MPKEQKTPVNRAVDGVVKCTVCGAHLGACDCWQRCECGWNYRKGEMCNNPVHRKPKPE